MCVLAATRGPTHVKVKTLELHNVDFSYGGTAVLARVDCFLAESEIVTICGPSGCGKTTLLLLLAGLLEPTKGQRLLLQQLDPRGIIYVPQQDVLLPWFSLRR